MNRVVVFMIMRLWELSWRHAKRNINYQAKKNSFLEQFSRPISCIDLLLLFALLPSIQMHPNRVHKAVIQITAPSLSGEDEEWAFAATLISNAFHPLNQ
jgi:hypothetical protein